MLDPEIQEMLGNQADRLAPFIKSLTVEAQHKTWTQRAIQGDSGGTTIAVTVVPNHNDAAWTLKQAKLVFLRTRKELQKMVLLDASARGEDISKAQEVLAQYDIFIAQMTTDIMQPAADPTPTQV